MAWVVPISPYLPRPCEKRREDIVYRLAGDDDINIFPNCPRCYHLGMCITYHQVELTDDGMFERRITDEDLREWGMERSDLYESAKRNTPRIFPMKLTEANGVYIKKGKAPVEKPPGYVISNERGTWGITSLLYKGTLELLSQKMGGSYYVLPVSEHYAFILPPQVGDSAAIEAFKKALKQTNSEEWISRDVFKYDTEGKALDSITMPKYPPMLDFY